MKLTKARVLNFRCVDDSGAFSLGSVTCLVGKNESGKTSLLQALEKLNPVYSNRKAIDKYRDYPRVKLNDYEKDDLLLETEWSLDDEDVPAIEGKFGKGALQNNSVRVFLQHDESLSWEIALNHAAINSHFIADAGCDALEAELLLKCVDSNDLATTARAMATSSERVRTLLAKLGAFRESKPELGILDLLSARMPKFLYFSVYDRMNGAVALNDLNYRKGQNQLTPNDHVFLSFLEYAGTSIEDVVALQQYEPLKAKAEAAGISITRRLFKYWSQNKNLKVRFEITPALPQDPAPFNAGMIVRTRILNTLHDMTVEFDNRSAGFVWFFSFLVVFSQVAKKHGNVIILLDEPGLNLHGKAQGDLLRFIEEELEPKHQVIYTTHSPFMVPARRLDTVRTVEDVVIEKKNGDKEICGTKVGDEVLSVDPDTVFPIQGALGYDISQSLFVGHDTLLVEGPSDILYFQAMSAELNRRKRTGLSEKWTICPTGGINKISAFLTLFAGNQLHVAVFSDYSTGQKNAVEQLKTSKILQAGHVFVATQFTGKAESDLEDMLGDHLYLRLVNSALSLDAARGITDKDLDASGESNPTAVKRVEAAIRLRSDLPDFNHFLPALWLIKNSTFLATDDAEVLAALQRFEELFKLLNRLV